MYATGESGLTFLMEILVEKKQTNCNQQGRGAIKEVQRIPNYLWIHVHQNGDWKTALIERLLPPPKVPRHFANFGPTLKSRSGSDTFDLIALLIFLEETLSQNFLSF